MKKRLIYKGFLDAFINSLFLFGINIFFLTIYAVNFSVKKCLFVELAAAIILSIIFFILIFKENNKNILKYIYTSIFSFPLFLIVTIIVYYLIPLKKNIPFYDTNAGNGLLCMVGCIFFIITSIILKVIITICLLVKNKKLGNSPTT